MIRGIHHVAVSTPNLDRIVDFYSRVIGAEVVYETSWQQGSDVIDAIVGLKGSAARQAMLRLGNAHIEFFEYSAPPGEPLPSRYGVNNHGYTHFCMDVKDIDAEYARLSAAGVTFHCPPPDFSGGKVRATYGRDPDGNVIEIQEILDTAHPFAMERTVSRFE